MTDAIYKKGFVPSSHAYEDSLLGRLSARFVQGGRGERIGYTAARSPFGWLIVGATERGVCWLSLADTETEAEASLHEEFPQAALRRDSSLVGLVDAAIELVTRDQPLVGTDSSHESALNFSANLKSALIPNLDLRGTAFQLRVWQALRAIPRGETRSYSQLARTLGNSKATRAVARACAANRVSLFVPCHRVVGVDGSLTGYRWGLERKRQLLDLERG